MKTVEEWRQHWLSSMNGYGLLELIRDVQSEALAHAREECAAEIDRLEAELNVSRGDLAHLATYTRDRIQAEAAAIRESPPHTGNTPSESTESPLDKAAREAFERHVERSVTAAEWSKYPHQAVVEAWRRVVAPLIKGDSPKPKSDGELLCEAYNAKVMLPLSAADFWMHTAEEFIAKRAAYVARLEDALYMAICIIRNEAGPVCDAKKAERLNRWCAELIEESGINFDAVMNRSILREAGGAT